MTTQELVIPAHAAANAALGTAYKRQDQIAVALGGKIDPERFLRVMSTSCQRNPVLLKADPISFFGAVLEAAQLRLLIDGALGQAHLVPFWNKRMNNGQGAYEVVLVIGYRGLIRLAQNADPNLHHFDVELVYQGDEFDILRGTAPGIHHRPCHWKDRTGSWDYAYSVALYSNGPPAFAHMGRDEIEALSQGILKRMGKRAPASPWSTDFDAMAKKTVLRRVCKYLDLSADVTRALYREDALDQGRFADLSTMPAQDAGPPKLGAEVGSIAEAQAAAGAQEGQPPEEEGDAFADVAPGDAEPSAEEIHATGDPEGEWLAELATEEQRARLRALCETKHDMAAAVRRELDKRYAPGVAFETLDVEQAEELLQEFGG